MYRILSSRNTNKCIIRNVLYHFPLNIGYQYLVVELINVCDASTYVARHRRAKRWNLRQLPQLKVKHHFVMFIQINTS